VGVIRSRLSLLNPGAGQGSDWIVGHGERMVSQCGQHPKRLKALSMTGRKRHKRWEDGTEVVCVAAIRRQWCCMKLSDVYFKFIPHTEGEQIIIVEGPGVPDKTLGQIHRRTVHAPYSKYSTEQLYSQSKERQETVRTDSYCFLHRGPEPSS